MESPAAIPKTCGDRVNLIYLFDIERIHVIGRNRDAVPSDHDPL